MNEKKILVVDDEVEICDLIKSILERTGRYNVLTAQRATKGIELAKMNKPDMILLDVMMPDMEGTEAAQILCEDETTRGITIVFVTAIAIPMVFLQSLVTNDGLKQQAGRVGGHYFIQKPISPKELVQRIDEIFGASGS